MMVLDVAPPLPRGSTLDQGDSVEPASGSPAPAGIDPTRPPVQSDICRLPRSRGDRPDTPATTEKLPEAPPLPRGSTLGRVLDRQAAGGSPAPAGIDPLRGHPWRARSRLPRSRGDRPRASSARRRIREAPPLPRGSTRGGQAAAPRLRGSPAPAGIDPPDAGGTSTPMRLPRSRGDRPFIGSVNRDYDEAPPLPRGSTLGIAGHLSFGEGSPAPAGIDRCPARLSLKMFGLPRSRGDRP